MNSPIRIGIIGSGRIADQGHMPGIQSYPGAQVTVACDTDAARLRAFAATYDVPEVRSDWLDVLDPALVDVVCVCLPNALHAPVTLAALDKGLHVLCEKPMAVTAAEADAMAAAARRNGRLLAIKTHNRFRPSALRARAILDSGRLGEVYHTTVSCYRRDGIPGVGTWFTRRSLAGGGALADSGIHGLDTALWLLGFPAVERVTAQTSRRLGQAAAGEAAVFDVEDSAFAHVHLAGDSSLTFAGTWAAYRDDAEVIEFLGTKGGLTLTWDNDSDSIRIFGPDPAADEVIDLTPRAGEPGPWSEAHVRATHAFLNAVENGLPSPLDPDVSARVMRLIETIYESADAHRELAY
jgi:predicted dehydrogenase